MRTMFSGRHSTTRLITTAALGLLALAWLLSLPLPRLPGAPVTRLTSLPPAFDTLLRDPPSWRDTLVLDLRGADPVVQQRLGFLTWSDGTGRAESLPLYLRADGHTRRYVIPIGAHPGWRGAVGDLRLTFSAQIDTEVTVASARLFRRMPWALDALLLRMIAPVLPRFPPWSHVVLLVAALVGLALALVAPVADRRRRLAGLALLLGGVAGGSATLDQIGLLRTLLPRYSAVSEQAAAALVPAYHEVSALNQVLVAAADELPAGPVVIVGAQPEDYLVYRARYVLAPRRVDVRPGGVIPPAAYVGLIQRAGERPPPGWEAATQPGEQIQAWRAPGLPPVSRTPPGQPTALLLGLGLIVAVGWWIGGWLGWRGWLRLAAGWPLGGALLALWMFGLDLAGLRWSVLSVSVPLLLTLVTALMTTARQDRWPRWTLALGRWPLAGWLLVALLSAAVILQALLLPLTDQDSWRMWGLKGRAFFLDGSIAPTLTRYPEVDLHQPAYPPLQPLIQTLGYVLMGGIHERAIKLIFPLWYIAAVLLTYQACAAWSQRAAALGWALLLATTPLVLDHATLGNADLPLAVALLLGTYALAEWIAAGDLRQLVGGVVSLAIAAWTKVDGLYLGLLVLLLALAVRLWSVRGRTPLRSTLGHGLMALLAFALLVVPWPIYAAQIGVRLDLPTLADAQARGWGGLSTSLAEVGAELLLSYNNSAWGLLGGGFGALWLVCGGALMLYADRLWRDPVAVFLALAVLGGIGFYVLIYVVRPLPSIERFVLHLAPLAILAAARLTAANLHPHQTLMQQSARARSDGSHR